MQFRACRLTSLTHNSSSTTALTRSAGHKRGKETRLEKERDLTDQEVEKLNSEYRATHPNPTTTADEGAPMDEVKEGIHDTESTTKNAEVGGGEQTSVPVP